VSLAEQLLISEIKLDAVTVSQFFAKHFVGCIFCYYDAD
jgi:hypothetical protein